jgi:RNA polymerase sigma factor (sigma-70 family)
MGKKDKLLVLDVGNTNITLGVFKGKKLLQNFRLTTGSARTSDEYGMFISQLLTLKGFSPEEIALAENATAATESIQRESGEDGFSLENLLTDTESEDAMLEKISLRQAIEKLPEREAMVIKLRYFHGLTQQRVSKVLGVSQVQVSRIEKRVLEKLRVLRT